MSRLLVVLADRGFGRVMEAVDARLIRRRGGAAAPAPGQRGQGRQPLRPSLGTGSVSKCQWRLTYRSSTSLSCLATGLTNGITIQARRSLSMYGLLFHSTWRLTFIQRLVIFGMVILAEHCARAGEKRYGRI